jgi:hypothetical protein
MTYDELVKNHPTVAVKMIEMYTTFTLFGGESQEITLAAWFSDPCGAGKVSPSYLVRVRPQYAAELLRALRIKYTEAETVIAHLLDEEKI